MPASIAIDIEEFSKMHFRMSVIMVYGAHRVVKLNDSHLGEWPKIWFMAHEVKHKIILDMARFTSKVPNLKFVMIFLTCNKKLVTRHMKSELRNTMS